MRRDILAKDVANRERLFSEFLKEVGNLYFDSVNPTLDDTSQQASLITMYSLVGRIRMISSKAVLTSAEKVADDIVESYKRPPTTFQEFQQSWEASNAWHEFTKACSSRAAKHAGTLIVLPVANRAFAHCRSNYEDWLPRSSLARVLFQTMLERTSPFNLAVCSRFFISASISGMINGAKSNIPGAALRIAWDWFSERDRYLHTSSPCWHWRAYDMGF